MATVPNYVRFTRGTPTAYENLQHKDPDTLYFISENDADRGILYLGTKIIAGGSSNISVTSLGDLTDVLLSNNVAANSVLMYDAEQDKWVDKTLADIAALIAPVMVGATDEDDGKSGLVPVPLAGQEDFVLLGNGTWSSGLYDLTAVVQTIVGDDDGMSAREIAESVFEDYVGSMDDFKDLMDWFEKNPDFTDFNKRLNTIEGTVFDTGSLDGGDYQPGLETRVGNLEFAMKDVKTELTNIYERLVWHEINEATGVEYNPVTLDEIGG
jgi:hypothetical protein